MKACLAALLFAVPLLCAAPRPLVLIFTRTDCPISNRYAPEVKKLYATYSDRADFRLVYVETAGRMERHLAEYELAIPAVLDRDHTYTRMAGATITPEAAVFVDGKLIYRGRIDDRNSSYGITRAEPLHRDLAEALADVLAGKLPSPRFTKAIGCAIEPLK
jgi:hypothetical protein